MSEPSDFKSLEDRYARIFDECMEMAACWRRKIAAGSLDNAFYADRHKRSLLRAARYARFANDARTPSLSSIAMLAAREPQP